MYISQRMSAGIVATATLQVIDRKGGVFWSFAFERWKLSDGEWIQPESEYVEVCMCFDQDPVKCLMKGIIIYELPICEHFADNRAIVDLMQDCDLVVPERFRAALEQEG